MTTVRESDTSGVAVSRAWTLAEALRYGHGIERPFLCFQHGDSRPSASVNVAKGKWYCFTCGAHGDLHGEALLVEPDYEQMRLWLDNLLAAQRVYPESWLNQYDAGPVHPYWLDRVGEAAARAFRLGYDDEQLTYPLRGSAGEVLGVVRRKLHGDGPKYRYPAGADMGSLLFNYSSAYRKALVLVEGALDAIALWNVGIDAMAIYGSRLSAAQVKLIAKIDPTYVYLCFDQDKAGAQATSDAEHALRHCLTDVLSWPRGWGKDIDEIGVEHRRDVVDPLVSAGLACIGSAA